MKLEATDLVKKYRSRTVVKGVSVNVEQGEIVGLLGPNGAGKTTTFYMIVGLIKPNEGRIHLDGKDITGLPMYKRAIQGVGYLPQEASVFRKLSVEDNIKAVLEMKRGLSKAEQSEKLESLLDEFGLQLVRKNRGDLLSGGERRRTEIARALASDPSFILLDEPFAGVDPIAVEDIQFIVSTLKSKNIGILITDHNVQETLSITDRAYLLFEGNILKAGSAEELAGDPEVRRVYLGQNFELKKKNNSLSDFWKTLSPLEIASVYQHRYETLMEASKGEFDSFIQSQFLTIDDLKDIISRAQQSGLPIDPDACPRCSSHKLQITKEEKVKTGKYEGAGAMAGGSVPMVEKKTCKVCGFIVDDPNA